MAKQKSTGWLDKYNDGKVAQADATRTKNTKNLGIKKGSDQPIGNMLDITLGAPQRQAVKMITGKEQSPSEAMDIQNPYGAFAADAILDPVNLIGAGIAGKIAKASTETGLLSKAYKLNPWAFKPNEANWYRQVGKSAIDDAFDTRLIREVGEEVSPRMWGEFQDQIKRLQGDDALGHEERMMQKILASRRPISPFFAKGELFYPMGRKEIITKSGKISKNSAGRGNADYLIETALPNESFQPAFVKGMSLGVPDMVGSTAILKPNPSLRDVSNFQLYKQDWLQGYKKLPKKENGGWLDKYNDGGPVQENYNDYSVSAPEGFQGDGYSNVGRDYSPAWGGQFAMGGSMPGAVGFTYARTNDPAPSNGPYAKKTKASAQNGTELAQFKPGGKAPKKGLYDSPENDKSKYDAQKSWLFNWMSNPEYNKRLAKNLKESNINTGKYDYSDYFDSKFRGDEYYRNKANELTEGAKKQMLRAKVFTPKSEVDDYDFKDKYINEFSTNDDFQKNNLVYSLYTNSGFYNPLKNQIFLQQDIDPGTAVHEFTHATGLDKLISNISKPGNKILKENELLKKKYNVRDIRTGYDNVKGKVNSILPNWLENRQVEINPDELTISPETRSYINQSEEIYPRIMDLRYRGGVKPGQIINKKNFKNIKSKTIDDAIFRVYDDNQIIEMMNKFAYNDNIQQQYTAKNGTEMKYYQEGLDWKPKTISRDGSQLVKLDQLTNFTNYNTKQPGGWLDRYDY
jgi:hypothetical protein